MRFARWARRQAGSLSVTGLLVGTLFFAAALTPSLVPRTHVLQGLLAGACFAVGYGLGTFGQWLWRYLELPDLKPRVRKFLVFPVAIFCFATALVFLWLAVDWQNSIRAAMGLEPVSSGHPVRVCIVALAAFVATLAVGRLFLWIATFIATFIKRYVPRRIANVVGVALAMLLFWSVANDFLARAIFRALDSSYREFDALFEPERPQPSDPGRTGSSASLVKWHELGRAGREFIASAPTAAEISTFTGRAAKEPIRVYVGLGGAAAASERAALALAELKRAGGFERSILIVITPTGTGWVDPSAMRPVEYLHHGDVASVAVQYSYLSSPLSLLVQPEYGAESARELFLTIYRYWRSLPRNARPRLYLHGLSLGAMNSEGSAQLFEMIEDPIDGALWSGPPFASRIWRSVTEARNAGSPQWLPEFQDGRIVRFMNQNGATVPPDRPWGPMRIAYLQYASDAIVFFDYRTLYRRPSWMNPPRGPDVSAALRWYPVVTMVQLALDMVIATRTPMGTGHVYAPEHYIDPWIAVTDVRDWSPEQVSALKKHLAEQARTPTGKDVEGYENRGG